MKTTGPSVIVIGAGIIGASAAYHLQSAGADVTVIDDGKDSATDASFGWINASFHHDVAHFRLRNAGIAAWRKLSDQACLDLRFQGALCWEESGAAFGAQRDRLVGLGYDVAEVSRAEFSKLEPHIANPPERALHFPAEAAANSPAVARALLANAVEAGARCVRGLRVAGLLEESGRITGIQTEAGQTRADAVLISAGIGSERLMSGAGFNLPMLRRPGLMLRTRPIEQVLSHVLVTEFGELRQLADGSLMMPAAANHQGDTSDSLTEPLEDVVASVLGRLQSMLPDKTLDWQEIKHALRPVPEDGLPVIGEVCAGLHVACMHSGLTLGAVAGELVAQEILAGVTNASGAMLAPYRPGRFEK